MGLFQDYNSTDWRQLPPTHAFDATFEIGKSYHLTVGIIGGGGGMTVGSSMLLSLYYRDALNNKVTVGATPVTYTTDTFPNTTHFLDFSVDIAEVLATDAWAGQKIGIDLLSTFGTGAGYWDVDNVRLVSQVPEPSAFALAGLAAFGLIARKIRRQRLGSV